MKIASVADEGLRKKRVYSLYQEFTRARIVACRCVGYCDYFDQRSYIKFETLRAKKLTEIHGALSEVCGEFTVDRSTVSHLG